MLCLLYCAEKRAPPVVGARVHPLSLAAAGSDLGSFSTRSIKYHLLHYYVVVHVSPKTGALPNTLSLDVTRFGFFLLRAICER